MTEKEYLECSSPDELLGFLDGEVSGRSLRLFAAACCRRIRDQLAGQDGWELVELTERFADGLVPTPEWEVVAARVRAEEDAADEHAARGAFATPEEDERAWQRAEALGAVAALGDADPLDCAARAAECAAWAVARKEALAALGTDSWSERWEESEWREQEAQSALLRDVASPFHDPAPFEPAWHAWNDGLIARLAQDIYESGAWERMPILGDALEEAGCADEVVLAHTRSGGPHIKGCWLLAWVLGR